MRHIFKYPVTGEPIKMPSGAKILSAGMQDGAMDDQIYVWALVDPKEKLLEYRFIDAHFTGPGVKEPFHFIATLQAKSGLVYHVVEHIEEV